MRIEFRTGKHTDVTCDLMAVPVFEEEVKDAAALRELDRASRGVLKAALASGEFKTELHRTCLVHRPAGFKAGRLLLIGGGKRSDFVLARLREVAGAAVRAGRSAACGSVALLARGGHPLGEAARVCAEGALYGNYEPDDYKTRDWESREVDEFVFVSEGEARSREIQQGILRGIVIGNATNLARNLVNEPANILTPTRFAERALELGAEAGLEVQIIEQEEMEKLGMNTLLAVSRGSEQPPKLIVLRIKDQERKAGKGVPLYALVGKGVTFDSGGISIKPAEKMEEMKADMAGGAAVLGTMIALGQLRPHNRVIGLIPAVENLPSGRATKPGDVVKSFLGKTVEITNTDAEGRLIMADVLAYARSQGATHLVDIATLTGACVIALGWHNAGVMGTNQSMIDRLRKYCSVTGERLWQLPLDDEYRKILRSEIADIKNVGHRYGGAITAAKFLQEFVEDTPWVHIDIAGVDMDHEGRPFAAKGGTGFGVRTLVQLFVAPFRE